MKGLQRKVKIYPSYLYIHLPILLASLGKYRDTGGGTISKSFVFPSISPEILPLSNN